MPSPERKRELGRGERTLPGVWRLRLPLPWPGVPHGNAWAVAHGDGFVLFDTGIDEPGSEKQLDRALEMVGLELENVRLLVCTHAHSDHYGQAATIVERSGCEVWMHPNHEHMKRGAEDPAASLDRRLEVARQSGVPVEALQAYQERRKGQPSGIERIVSPDRELLPGVEVETDLGNWQVIETPGHAPSHVCLFQSERRLLISGDHLLGRVSLYYDYGYTPDPAGEFLASLEAVEALDARLCLPGHGRTFTDVSAHIEANRGLITERVENAYEAIRGESLTALEVQPHVHGVALDERTGNWWLSETLVYLNHLEVTGRAQRQGDDPQRWRAVEERD